MKRVALCHFSASRSLGLLLGPVVTEKVSVISGNSGRYAIFVSRSATKSSIKFAMKCVFGVDLRRVSTVNVKGKRKVFKGSVGKRSDRKKVYFSIAKGQSIDLLGV